MRILLVNPPNSGKSIPEEEFGITTIKKIFKGEPLGLEALAGNLYQHDVKIIDLKVTPDLLFDTFTQFSPDIVSFTAVTCEANSVLEYSKKLKAVGNPYIVVGGIHATYDPNYFNSEFIDFIVIGIGKESFRLLAQYLENNDRKKIDIKIPGIAKTNPNSSLLFNKKNYDYSDLADDKAPRYDLVESYRNSYILDKLGMKIGFVVTAMGCTHQCLFCSVPKISGGKYLTHSTDSVIRDINILKDLPLIRLVDANSFGDILYSKNLCEKILSQGIKKYIAADIRADTAANFPDLIKNWRKAGLSIAIVGFEEISDFRLQIFNKKTNVKTCIDAINIFHDNGIKIVGDFIVSPDYTHEDFDNLKKFIIEHKIDIPILSILTPIPGTPLYEKMKKNIINYNYDYYTFLNAVIPTKLDNKTFYKLFAETFMMFH